MDESPELLKTLLHDQHVALGAVMGEEAGWAVPLHYGGPLEEVRRVRGGAGVCDLSHVGRIRIRGAGALDLLERVCTADVVHQEDDTALLTLLCNERGGVLDVGFLVRLTNQWLLTTSPDNRLKVLAHLQDHAAAFDAKVDDQTTKSVLLEVCGPAASGTLDAVLPEPVAKRPRGWAKMGSFLVARYVVMRVGQTGLWSLQTMLPGMIASRAWGFITKKAGDNAIAPFGSAARDVLRIESGLPRWGHEVNETVDPITAGLERAVDFGHEFLGREAVLKVKESGPARALVGLAATGEGECGIPRLGAAVRDADGAEVGTVTSGTFSPTLDRPIALAHLSRAAADAWTPVRVETGSGEGPFEVVELPFCR